jgi:hypothetical protein
MCRLYWVRTHQLALILCHQHHILLILAADEPRKCKGLVWLAGLWQCC